MNKPIEITGTLEQWYKDPWYNIIWGHVYGDTKHRFFDGQKIHTSDVLNARGTVFEPGDVVHTLNSVYKLGKKAK